MTHRSFSIVAKGDDFGFAITTTYEKGKKGIKHYIYGYLSPKAANSDIGRLIEHFERKKHLSSFLSNYGKPLKTDLKRERHDLSGTLNGLYKDFTISGTLTPYRFYGKEEYTKTKCKAGRHRA